jgi:hypothetical protein
VTDERGALPPALPLKSHERRVRVIEIGLVSCTKSKRDTPAPPGELYDTSTLFQKASAYAERTHDEWYVLSAKHGLLDPDGPAIEPYDETLTGATVDERTAWAERVAAEPEEAGLLRDDVTLVFHAGQDYTDPLTELVEAAPFARWRFRQLASG